MSKSFSCFTENNSTTVEQLGGPQNNREVIHDFKRFSYRKIYFNCGPLVFLWLPSLKNLQVLMASSLLYFLFYYASLVLIISCTCGSSWNYQSALETKTLGLYMKSCNIHLCLLMVFRKSPSILLSVLLHKVKCKKIKFLGLSNTRNSHLEQLKAYVNAL